MLVCWRAAQVGELLTPLVSDPDVSIEVASFAAVALGLVFLGTCHAATVEAILQARHSQALFTPMCQYCMRHAPSGFAGCSTCCGALGIVCICLGGLGIAETSGCLQPR